MTRLPKTTFTFGLGPTVWLHEAIEYSAHKLIRQRKYFFWNLGLWNLELYVIPDAEQNGLKSMFQIANVTFDVDQLCGASSQQYFCLKQALHGIATLRNKERNMEQVVLEKLGFSGRECTFG